MALQEYHEPTAIADAVSLLAAEGARAISGGATLVAMMNARLVEPTSLISLRRIDGLSGITQGTDGGLRIGAMTRHRETASDARLTGANTVLRMAAGKIANPVVRNMGTIGGSVAFFDPAADYPPALVAAGAEIEIAGPTGTRRLPAEEFFVDWYTTALEAAEIVVAIHLPASPDHGVPGGAIGLYDKLARVEGDYAIASVALTGSFEGKRCTALRIAIGGCGPTPVRLPDAEALLVGHDLDAARVAEAGAMLAAALDPVDDVRASGDYRRLVVPRMVARALRCAAGGAP